MEMKHQTANNIDVYAELNRLAILFDDHDRMAEAHVARTLADEMEAQDNDDDCADNVS
jgi:hypothetical protein